ncbi:MAG: thiamine phosphate synthase [bacterium]
MLWMITDFARYGTSKEAIEHIKICFESGVNKLTLRNKCLDKKNLLQEVETTLHNTFSDREIFIHNPSKAEIEKRNCLHFTSKEMDNALKTKEKYPQKTISLSTHSQSEYEKAFNHGIDYAFFSPVFKPISKPDDKRKTVSPVKMQNLYLLGGIDKSKALWLIEKGFYNIAGISLFYGKNMKNDILDISLKMMEKEQ